MDQAKEAAKIVVIGAGMVGVCCALYLQRAGHRVILVDANEPGSGASYGNAATFASYACIPVNHPKLLTALPALLWGSARPLSISLTYMPTMLPWLLSFLRHCRRAEVNHIINALGVLLAHAEDAAMTLFRSSDALNLIRRNGTIYLYSSEKSLAGAQDDIQRRRRQGVAITELDISDIQNLEPQLASVFAGGVLYDDGFQLLDPQQIILKMVEKFAADGGQVLREKVTSLARNDSGDIQVIGDSRSISARQVVLAAGAQSQTIRSGLIDPLPLDTERGYHVMFPDSATLLNRPVGLADAGLYLSPLNLGLRAAGTVELAGLNAPPNPARLAYIERWVHRVLPQVGQRGDTWLGFRPTLPDSLPVIGRSSRHSGLVYAFGHHHIGITLGGITGKLVQQIIDGLPPTVDLTPYRPERFAR